MHRTAVTHRQQRRRRPRRVVATIHLPSAATTIRLRRVVATIQRRRGAVSSTAVAATRPPRLHRTSRRRHRGACLVGETQHGVVAWHRRHHMGGCHRLSSSSCRQMTAAIGSSREAVAISVRLTAQLRARTRVICSLPEADVLRNTMLNVLQVSLDAIRPLPSETHRGLTKAVARQYSARLLQPFVLDQS